MFGLRSISLLVQDVTKDHVSDMKLLQSIGDQIAAVNDNLRGIQSQGGRKSATEVRISTESGASRLANVARLISAQAVVDLTEQMVSNIQQFLSESFYVTITGKDGVDAPLYVSPDMLSGDFHFPIHDGTLPMDKTMLIEAWNEVMQLVATDEELRGTFSLVKLLEHVADLAGAKGLDLFKVEINQMQQGQEMPPTRLVLMKQCNRWGNVMWHDSSRKELKKFIESDTGAVVLQKLTEMRDNNNNLQAVVGGAESYQEAGYKATAAAGFVRGVDSCLLLIESLLREE